jgi:predicted nucleic acid-binding protein
MKTAFVDANVFLRFFTTDDEGQHQRAAALFRKAAAGRISLITGPPVLFEIAWTLRSAYAQSRDTVLDVLSRMATLPGLRLLDGPVVEEALGLARRSGREFADAYILASAQQANADGIATFNRRDFEKLGAKLLPF